MFARKKERALEKRLRTGRINKAEKLAKGVTQRPRGEVSEEASLDLPARPAGWKDDTLEGLVRGLVPEQTVLLVVGTKGRQAYREIRMCLWRGWADLSEKSLVAVSPPPSSQNQKCPGLHSWS